MSEHISRKELKQDKVRETFEHGAEAVLSHTRITAIALLVLIVAGSGYLGWKYYTDRQNAQGQAELDDALKIFSAPIEAPGQPPIPVSQHIRILHSARKTQKSNLLRSRQNIPTQDLAIWRATIRRCA